MDCEVNPSQLSPRRVFRTTVLSASECIGIPCHSRCGPDGSVVVWAIERRWISLARGGGRIDPEECQ